MQLIILIVTMLSTPAWANGVEAPGKMTYKMPSGELVTRDAVLTVPSRGLGDVTLRGAGSGEESVADKFFTEKKQGRSIFYIVFDEFPGATPGTNSVLRGTYLRGSNQAIYYGDVFLINSGLENDEISALIAGDNRMGRAKHVAGFMFKADAR